MATAMHNSQALMKKIQSLPADRVAEVEDFVDFLKERVKVRKTIAASKQTLDFPVDELGTWPEDLSLSREDMYGDDGR